LLEVYINIYIYIYTAVDCEPSTNNTPLRVMHSRPSLRGPLAYYRYASRFALRASRFALRASLQKRKKQAENVQFVPLCTTPECLYHAQKRSKTCNFQKPFKHVKIYLTCDLTTKYQVIPPINGREITKNHFFFRAFSIWRATYLERFSLQSTLSTNQTSD
jgi:hypothetical protein